MAPIHHSWFVTVSFCSLIRKLLSINGNNFKLPSLVFIWMAPCLLCKSSSLLTCQVKILKELSGEYNLEMVVSESKGNWNEWGVLRALTSILVKKLSERNLVAASVEATICCPYPARLSCCWTSILSVSLLTKDCAMIVFRQIEKMISSRDRLFTVNIYGTKFG